MINICIIATIVIYLVGMLLVGFVYSKSNEDSSDFYLGGRTMGPLVTAMSLFGVDYMAAMILSAVVIVGYTIMGGFRAVSTTDLIQSVVMSMALIAVLVYGVNVAGGWDVVLDNARSLPGYLTMAASHNAADNTATSYSLLDIASTLAWGLGYFGMPHILLRFMAIEDEKKLVLSRRIASVWVVIAMTASIVIGMVGLGMTKAGALEFLSGSSSETLIVRVASLIAQHGVLAAILAGLILAGILAATMSTADSQMLAAASSVSQNILQEFGHMKLTEKQSLFAASAWWAWCWPATPTPACSASSALHGPALAAPLAQWCCAPCSGSAATGRAHWPVCSPAA